MLRFFKSLSTLQWALGLSVLLHAALLTVRFVDPEGFKRVFEDTTLDVILVNAESDEKPVKAQAQALALAQATLAGGGEAEGKRIVSTPLPPRGFTTDSQVVFAPHLYNESITMDQSLGVTLVGLERGWALAERAAANWGAPLWVGEWGIWRDEQENRRYYERFMAQADAATAGTALWQWKQACGDPHSYPSEESGNVRRMSCPDGSPLPTRTEELEPVTRAYPRSAPGRLESIESTDSALRITGSTSGVGPVDGRAEACSLDVWVPGAAEPTVGDVVGVTSVSTVRVPEGSAPQDPSGGWRVLGCATGDWSLTLS